MKAQHLTCRLLNEGETYQTALKNIDDLNIYPVKSSLGFRGIIAVSNQFSNQPNWFDTISFCAEDEVRPVENMSSRAVLFVESGARILVFTFGQGRCLLNPDIVVGDFGLKVALNSIDPELMRSIDAKTIDEKTMSTRRQSSRTSALETFGLNISRDLIKAVNGIPSDKNFAKNITGAEALAFSAEFKIEDLGTKCAELIEMYERETYKERFSWIDNLKVVKNKAKIVALNEALVVSLQNKDFENMYLAPPEIFDWQDIQGFNFSNNRDQDDLKVDLKIEDYLSYYPNTQEISIDVLKKKDRVSMVVGDDYKKDWSVYKCLVYEVSTGDGLYVLTEGRWYKISNTFVSEINEKVMQINISNLELPIAGASEREDAYNDRTASERGFCLLDKKNISPESGRSKIEFCDLLTSDKQLIHVKKRASSSTLSHLFAQGRISALTFLDHQGFREKVRVKIGELKPDMVNLIPVGRPTTSQFEIVYAIITSIVEPNWQLKLPFFSRLNLVETCKDLERLGFRVSILKIKKQTS